MTKDCRSCCTPGGHGRQRSTVTNASAAEPLAGMEKIPAGAFRMGCDRGDGPVSDGEGPVRKIFLDEFWIGKTTVTNQEFSDFVAATGYLTDAERYGWSFVFWLAIRREAREFVIPRPVATAPWWRGVRGASWRHPEGPGSTIADRLDHPAVHLSWNDAQAMSEWAGTRLPTEAEWEKAARGGVDGLRYPWGNELAPNGQHYCNIWQGKFPQSNTAQDGYLITAPARSFEPNGYALWNMVGNVWEWTADRWSPDWHVEASDTTRINPKGPAKGIPRVIRGGSYLCHEAWCNRYRNAARTFNNPDGSTSHMGIRLAWSMPAQDPDGYRTLA